MANVLFTKVIVEANHDLNELIYPLKSNFALLKILKQSLFCYYQNQITLEEYNSIFSCINLIELNAGLKANQSDWYESLRITRKYTFHKRTSEIVVLNSLSRYYSKENLDKVWNYLIRFLNFDLSSDYLCHDLFLKLFLQTAQTFETFDYTDSEKYLNEKVTFKDLNRNFYRKYKKFFHKNLRNYSAYLSVLLNLNCYLDDAFTEFLDVYKELYDKKSNIVRLSNIIHFIAINNQYYSNLSIGGKILATPNNRFLKDFKTFYSGYLNNNHNIEMIKHTELAFDKDLNIVTSGGSSAKHVVPIWLLDNVLFYQNKPILKKNISSNLKMLEKRNLPQLVISEQEFYGQDFDLVFKKKIEEIINKLKK